MTNRVAAALVASAFLLSACGGWDPLVAIGIRSESNNKPTALAPITASVTPRVAWTASVGKAGGFPLHPQLADNRVYAVAADGGLTVLDADTGKVATRVDLKKKISGGVGVAEGKVLLGTLKGDVMALDLSGKVLWSTQLAGEVLAAPAIARKVVVARTADGRIFGLSVEDGKRVWVFQRPAPPLLLRSDAGVVTAGGDIVAGYANGKLIALDSDDGKLTWEVTVSPPRGSTELERIADIAGAPLLDGGNVCAGAFQGKVACFEVVTRNMLWSRDVSTSLPLARDAKNLYVTDDASAVHALDRVTGASAWKQDKLLYRRLTAPLPHEGHILVGDGFGFLHVLSPDDGAIIGRVATDGSAILALVPVAGGVILQTEKGTVAFVKI